MNTSPFARDLLVGRRAVVTGGATGIGFEIAAAFLSHGAEVAITSRNGDRLRKASERLGASTGRQPMVCVCDVRDELAVDALHEAVTRELGPIDILVNNAAGNFRMHAEKMTRRALTTVVDIDLMGTFNVTRRFIDQMINLRRGVILSIVVPESERGFPFFSHAGCAKAGIVSLTRSWAREWGRHGIRTVAIGPGPIPTEGAAQHMMGLPPEQMYSDHIADIPLGRLGKPEDVARAALFLCSDAAAWITGVVLNVDGGVSVA